MKKPELSITPLGGVGEIGSNMTLVETSTSQIIIDCGILFPYEDFFDINYLIPDFTFIDKSKLKALVITHGHEDHIGAIHHFVQTFPEIPIYCTQFTAILIRRKIENLTQKPTFVFYEESSIMRFDELEIHPVHVTHSIPDTMGLILKTTNWSSLYISDFKVDLSPSFEAKFNIEKIKNIFSGPQKKIAFLDSTNILNEKKTLTEDELQADLDEIISLENDRIFFTLFSSNIHRLDRIIGIAKKNKRQIVVLGRSMDTYIKAGIEAQVMNASESDIHASNQHLAQRLLVLVSGCQGDFLSALRRLSSGEDSTFKLTSKDLVVFSSKVIPGNEKKIARIYNQITQHGTQIITAYDKQIHASGHPGQQDLEILIKAIQPEIYVPIHGETYFLEKHCQFISKKFPHIQPVKIGNYTTVNLFSDKTFKTFQNEVKEPRLIHGKDLEIERTKISERRKMANSGVVFVTLDKNKMSVVTTLVGLPVFCDDLKDHTEKLISQKFQSDLRTKEDDYVKEQLRIGVRQFFNSRLGYKPTTIIHLL